MSRARRAAGGGRWGGAEAEADKGAVTRLAAAGESDGSHSEETNGFVAKVIKSDVLFMKTGSEIIKPKR